MQGFKIGFLAGLLVGALALFGFFGLDRLKNGEDYLVKESQVARVENSTPEVNFQIENNLEETITEVAVNQESVPDNVNDTVIANTSPEIITTNNEQNQDKITSKDQELISALEKLISDKVVMDLKSRGTRVGTIQEFLNLYENKTLKVDNDYGTGTKERIRNFQKNSNLSADGQTGIATYQAMIDWLKNN